MRNIKFRIGLKCRHDEKTLVIFANLHDDANGLIKYPIDTDYWDIETIDEFTGLLDKNGAEIYEGDIVVITGTGEDPSVIESKITFGHHGACYKHNDYLCRLDMFCGPFKDTRIGTTVEVIGNIHESPELLEA